MSQLVLKGITKSFVSPAGLKTVIHPLDLTVTDGAFVSLLGPSGCGKTTLLRMVAGLETPTTGEIRIGDRLVDAPGTGVRVPPEDRGLGMVFQSYAVWPHLTVLENVVYPLRYIHRLRGGEAWPRARRVEAAMKALRLVHLEELRDRYPHQLSGGQQQRVALARGLVMEPPVLLLDEPLSNLDARLRAELRREIRDLHRQLRMTILYVTHDQREAFEMSTEVLVLDQGRIAQRGTPEEIRRAPAAGFVSEFLAEH